MQSTVQLCNPFEAQTKRTYSKFGSRAAWGVCCSRMEPTLFVALLVLDASVPAQRASFGPPKAAAGWNQPSLDGCLLHFSVPHNLLADALPSSVARSSWQG